jgi:hypothetical protein
VDSTTRARAARQAPNSSGGEVVHRGEVRHVGLAGRPVHERREILTGEVDLERDRLVSHKPTESADLVEAGDQGTADLGVAIRPASSDGNRRGRRRLPLHQWERGSDGERLNEELAPAGLRHRRDLRMIANRAVPVFPGCVSRLSAGSTNRRAPAKFQN